MNIDRFKIENSRRYITLFCAVIIILSCYFTIVKPMYLINTDSFKIVDTTDVYILALPILMIMNTFFDGFIIFKYKFNIIISEVWLAILFYISCRLYRYGMWWNTYTFWYYISALCSVVIMIMPFTVKACDNTGLIRVKKQDFIWIIILSVLIMGFVIRIYFIRNAEGLIFDDSISRLIYG
ncbi:MAG: hypothetical protein ACI4VF_01180 [Lachnospirales bacterium]